ncbi:hypothetical protein C4K37_3734 [Pseudomonas chlororaphis subsp. piscium]|nr:hypothetical protein C4K37_3734 [Pseudomonas chlororaphis subsp. piscium]AZC44665.1 hypothetical protein C4K36_3742 [Pseudomonas chlororaphis subsp. piscium]AZC76606.1 hypothetical protein C4K31_3705 [Pseudomonas chlororaphis subsp. piscium]
MPPRLAGACTPAPRKNCSHVLSCHGCPALQVNGINNV